MNKERYFPPVLAGNEYHCPHCNVYAKQRWSHLSAVGDIYSTFWQSGEVNSPSNIYRATKIKANIGDAWTVCICEHCEAISIWLDNIMIHPKINLAPPPNSDLSQEIQLDYLEAANVLQDSPRSAAALLRLALQKLCVQLGESGENINEDIGKLVKRGLSPTIQKSLDALRITGNNAVHPGQINFEENPDMVIKLFSLINFIAEKMITEPLEIDAFYEKLPESAKDAVARRDSDDAVAT